MDPREEWKEGGIAGMLQCGIRGCPSKLRCWAEKMGQKCEGVEEGMERKGAQQFGGIWLLLKET